MIHDDHLTSEISPPETQQRIALNKMELHPATRPYFLGHGTAQNNCALQKFQVCSSVPSMKKGPIHTFCPDPCPYYHSWNFKHFCHLVWVFITQINTVALIYSSNCLETSQRMIQLPLHNLF